jgi:hypothetical protein
VMLPPEAIVLHVMARTGLPDLCRTSPDADAPMVGHQQRGNDHGEEADDGRARRVTGVECGNDGLVARERLARRAIPARRRASSRSDRSESRAQAVATTSFRGREWLHACRDVSVAVHGTTPRHSIKLGTTGTSRGPTELRHGPSVPAQARRRRPHQVRVPCFRRTTQLRWPPAEASMGGY